MSKLARTTAMLLVAILVAGGTITAIASTRFTAPTTTAMT
jgi:hypothetical protein